MGVVHLARRPGGPRVALKVLRPHIIGDAEARQRLAQEVGSLSRIKSHRVAEIVDADPYGDIPYVATRYVPGYSLHQQVEAQGALPPDDLDWFARCLADALAEVHAVGVLHRDIKPSNVLMEGRSPVLIDFGLARLAEDPRLTHQGWLLGTPGYLAPEILYGEDATELSDVHSWAATTAYAGTGRPPFGSGPSVAVMDRVRRGEYRLDGIDTPVRELLTAALDPDPRARPTLREVRAWFTRDTPMTAVHRTVPADLRSTAMTPPMTMPLAMSPAAPAAAGTPTSGASADPETVRFAEEPVTARYAEEPATARYTEDHRRAPVLAAPAPRPAVAPRPADAPHQPVAPFPAGSDPAVPVPSAPPGTQPLPQQGVVPGTQFPPRNHPPFPGPRVRSTGEKARRTTLVVALGLAVGGLSAMAPVLTVLGVSLVVWFARAASLATGARNVRRQVRGAKWYDPVQTVLASPVHLVRAVPATVLLVLWGSGMGAAAALLCYAAGTAQTTGLAVTGFVSACAVWFGPGSLRLRGPVDTVLDPVTARPVPWLLLTLVVLALATGSMAASAQGTQWVPWTEAPLSVLR